MATMIRRGRHGSVITIWKPRTNLGRTFEQARARFRPIPKEERSDREVHRCRQGQWDWRLALATLVQGLVVMAVVALALALLVGLGVAAIWAITTDHDGYFWSTIFALLGMWLGVWLARKPRVQAFGAWLVELYGD